MKKNLVSLLLLICVVLSPAIGLADDDVTINVVLCCDNMNVQKITTYNTEEDVGHYHLINKDFKVYAWCEYTVHTEGGYKQCSNCGENHGTWKRTWESKHTITPL